MRRLAFTKYNKTELKAHTFSTLISMIREPVSGLYAFKSFGCGDLSVRFGDAKGYQACFTRFKYQELKVGNSLWTIANK